MVLNINSDLTNTYGILIEISRKMLQASHYEVAFHALEAALHCAEALKDEQRIVAVQREAALQRDYIDAEASNHRMSTNVAQERGGQNFYDLLIRQADVIINQIRHDLRQQRLGLPKLEEH